MNIHSKSRPTVFRAGQPTKEITGREERDIAVFCNGCNNSTLWIIILIIILFGCGCGNNGCGNGCGCASNYGCDNNCGCGC